MATELAAKPSDFPREEKFRDPRTPPFKDEHGVYHVFSYEDVMRVLMNRDNAFSRDPSPWLPPGPHHMALDFMWAFEPFPIEGKEGRHDALRKVVEPWFRTRAVRTMEPVIRELAVELIDGIVAKGTGELNLASELAYRLSMRVICRLTGIGLEREQWLREKLDEFARAKSYEELPLQWDVQAYFWQMAAKRLARPREELLDVLIEAWKAGQIDDDEWLGYVYGFVTAGTDTTGTHLANLFTLLAEFDLLDHVGGLLDDEDALRRIGEEVLRFGTPFPTKPLFVIEDSDFGELNVPKGSVLQIWFTAANRDEAVNAGARQSPPGVFDPQALAESARGARLGQALLPRRRPREARDADPPPRGDAETPGPGHGRRQAVHALRRRGRRSQRGLLPLRPGGRGADHPIGAPAPLT